MSDKSPRHSMSKKSGKTVKEKRAEKKAKINCQAALGGHHPSSAETLTTPRGWFLPVLADLGESHPTSTPATTATITGR